MRGLLPSRRGVLAAVTVVCAVTVLAAPGTAFAHAPATPAPAASSSPQGPAGSPTLRPTPPPNKDLEALRERLDKLYHDAAVATDAYNAAEEKARKQSAEIDELHRQIDEGRRKLDELKDRAGAAARAQYRTGGLPPEVRLVLSDDPEQFLNGTGLVLQGQRATKGMLAEMTRAQQDLRQYTDDASAQWRKLEANRKAKADAKKTIQKRIAAAEKLQSRLQKREMKRLAELEREAALKAQTAWLDTGILTKLKDRASEQGGKAVAFATAQLGKPYVWGAEGPDTYDCSGLTSQAWASADHPIPRTSQEQWKQLKHVDIKDMRPGDLIIYFHDASHVAMYVGDGTIIHAPRPGRTVTVAGAGSMPILGVVRPDTGKAGDGS
ncbi:NlpC/P60 family protein [Streptomyces sp. NPDC046805]|uniref:C40 family peptidase n=1 Tax=Streptomyces sp. NPDC046805 TaxID=3155134 RepID=UPI0033F1001D